MNEQRLSLSAQIYTLNLSKGQFTLRTGSQVTSSSVVAADWLVILVNSDWILNFAKFVLTSANELK